MNSDDVTPRDMLVFQLASGDWTLMIQMHLAVFKAF